MSTIIKLVWKEFKPKVLIVYAKYDHGAVTPTGLREEHLLPVQEWCEANNCGTRISFDMWKFKNKKEITAFLLKWG